MPKYLTEDLYLAIRLWREWKRFGLSAGKPDDETASYIDLLMAFENEYESAQADARSR